MATADAAKPEGINLIKFRAAANPLLKGLALVACLGIVLTSQAVLAQETATPNDVRDERSGAYALINATVHVDARTTVEDRVLLIRDGRVESMADSVPAGYVSIDLDGHHVFPSLIELDSGYGLPEPDKPAPFSFSAAEVLEPELSGAYNANQAIRSEYRSAESFTVDDEKAGAYRKNGFGAVLTHRADGIARGTGALVLTAADSDNDAVLKPDASTHFSFNKGSSPQSYPVSLMGAIALLRQTQLDWQWYDAGGNSEMTDLSLQAWGATRDLPAIFHVTSWLTAHRADQVGDEMGRQVILRGAGDEYQRSEVMQATGARFILPISFPKAPDLSDPWNTELVSLEEMKHWELAPGNPAAMDAAQIEFALTSRGAEKTFWDNLRKAVKHGLDRETALAALTSVPADMLGVSDTIGSLKPGRLASFLVADGDLFEEGSQIVQHWIAGDAYHLKQIPKDFTGEYTLRLGDDTYPLTIAGKPGKPKVSISVQSEGDDSGDEENGDDGSIDVTAALDYPAVTLSFSLTEDEAAVRLYGWMAESRWNGQGTLADGTPVAWVIAPTSASSEAAVAENDGESTDNGPDAESEDENDPTDQNGAITYPFLAYGRSAPVEASDLVIRNATIWTLEGEGILKQADLLVTDGRIAAIGESIDAGGAVEIDATGLHLTPGIIDEHSHIALLGVNDVATNSGMVRMNDVVNSEDVNIYRNLAGGVTAAQLLHGSANPIGGQSALIKMRWGSTPDEMLIEDADGFIKFALGENVKRSRNQASIRYPQSRMGVEQVYRDAFSSARDYGNAQQAWAEKSSRQRRGQTPPRRDLAMDAMLEILNGERHITCHSYVQSEINMLMHVAEDFDFKVNTFTHILEGYKVADKMAQHGAGGSTFADWWAYKWEVRYAIPYNPALMAEAGVTVAINSDSREMSRRLNQEAAKSIKYGDMDEVEALKMVTLNPAKLLHLDDRMGSLVVGKDADLVLWSHHPLSIDARALKTVVDGRVLYDEQEDRQMRDEIRAERARLVARIQSEPSGNSKGGGNGFKRNAVFHCDSITGYEYLLSHQGEAH